MAHALPNSPKVRSEYFDGVFKRYSDDVVSVPISEKGDQAIGDWLTITAGQSVADV